MAGNHAQALSLAAARTLPIPAYIVMPSISTPSKIAATRALTDHVIFSGSTSQEREERVRQVMSETGAVLVPPYDHADVVMGQGTVGVEMEGQFAGRREGQPCAVGFGAGGSGAGVGGKGRVQGRFVRPAKQFDVIVAPCGGGGLLSGIASYFFEEDEGDDENIDQQEEGERGFSGASTPAPGETSPTRPRRAGSRKTPYIIGAEPSFQEADDARRSLASDPPARIPHVKSLTVADGLRTPLGKDVTWPFISHRDPVSGRKKVEAIYAVSEEEIKASMRLLFERAKWVVEPSGAVALAVVLFNHAFRAWVQRRQREELEIRGDGEIRPWDVGVVISGGNTTMDAIAALFAPGTGEGGTGTGTGTKGEGEVRIRSEKSGAGFERERQRQRHEGKITLEGETAVEDVAG